MSVFKQAGVVVTTPSSGTYVIEQIGDVGRLADLLDARLAELPPDALAEARAAAEPEPSAADARAPLPAPARGGPRARANAPPPKRKREPSKTKAAIAAAKRRARLKAEREAAGKDFPASAEEEAATLVAARTLSSPRVREPSHHPDDVPSASFSFSDEEAHEAAEAMGAIAAPPRVAPREPAPEEPEPHPNLTPAELEADSASALAAMRVRATFAPGATVAFDAKEAALCRLRGWDDVPRCVVAEIRPDGGVLVADARGSTTPAARRCPTRPRRSVRRN